MELSALTILFVAIGLVIGWKTGAVLAGVAEMYYGEIVSYSVRNFLTRTIRIAILLGVTVAAYFLSKI